MTNQEVQTTSKPKQIPSWISIVMAFLSTFIYTGLFLYFKYGNLGAGVILLNIVYAAYAFFTLWLDRKNKFSKSSDARLVTLGTGLAPVAVALMDALLTYQTYIQQSPTWLLLLSFGIVFVIWFCMMLVASAIPSELKNKLKIPAHNNSDS
ncbi:hypothetical protein ACMGGS_12160 [Superficieibacter sp. BNK-5]|uniref:hypothetical protein n=1 Tax=Superficieibacter sp. BNK-5 TaxID=3376142 RepID=UPI0039BEDC7F